ncbi:MAG: YjzC family protein [Anaerolineales bacterium]|nr:YjzC family protein [Anaerolineales bacterium]
MTRNLSKPGEKPQKSGEYIEVGPQGGQVSNPRRVTIEQGDSPFPPTQKPNRRWERIGPPHKKGKSK